MVNIGHKGMKINLLWKEGSDTQNEVFLFNSLDIYIYFYKKKNQELWINTTKKSYILLTGINIQKEHI